MTDNPTNPSLPDPAPEEPQAAPEPQQAASNNSLPAPDTQPAAENVPSATSGAVESAAAAGKTGEKKDPSSKTVEPARPESTGKKVSEKRPAEKKPSGEKKPAAAPASKPAEKPAPRKKATLGTILAAMGMLLLEILVPVILSSVLLWWIFATFNLWSYNRTLTLVVFAVGMVAFSLLLSVMFDSVTRPARKKQRAAGVRFASAPLTRLVKLVAGGVALPLVVYAAASLMSLPASVPVHGTVMNYIISTSVQPVKLTPPDEIGSLALASKDPATKVLSIQVLQGFKSAPALSQLIRMASEDKAALSDPNVSDALSTAIAAYGQDARDPLIVMFKSVDPSQAGAATEGDAYSRYFTGSFDRLKAEVKASSLPADEKETRLAEIDAASAQLKTALKDLPAEKVSGDPRPDFALKTLLAVDLKEDPDLLAFAKSVAADRRYPASIRGSALLLIGKLGAKVDLDELYPYLKENDLVIQTRALQAIANLQTKLNGAPAK